MPSSITANLNGTGIGTSALAKTKLLDDATRARLGLPAAVTAASTKAKASLDGTPNGLGKDDFMKLLLAQMGNQDPLKPMEDKEFIAQLAQFNSLEQMQQLNKGMEKLAAAHVATQASTLLGQQVMARGANGIVTGEVRAVSISGGNPTLRVGTEEIALTDILQILVPGEPATVQETGGGTSSSGTTTSNGSTTQSG
jgi:flagellar basal-body rod modification protein FlgD